MIVLTEADRAAERVLADIPAKTIATTDGPVTVARPWETYLVARFGVEETERMLTTSVGANQEGEGVVMPKKDKKPRQFAPNGLGKCAFIDALYIEGGHTKLEIYAAAMAAFPGADPKSTQSTVDIRPGCVRRAGKEPKWTPEPKEPQAAHAAAQPATAHAEAAA